MAAKIEFVTFRYGIGSRDLEAKRELLLALYSLNDFDCKTRRCIREYSSERAQRVLLGRVGLTFGKRKMIHFYDWNIYPIPVFYQVFLSFFSLWFMTYLRVKRVRNFPFLNQLKCSGTKNCVNVFYFSSIWRGRLVIRSIFLHNWCFTLTTEVLYI